MKKKVTLKLKGRVQGVFFRVSTQAKARELGLTGWVQNETDGTVLLEAEGEEHKLQELIKWCQSGPEYAKVGKAEVDWQPPDGQYKDFSINR